MCGVGVGFCFWGPFHDGRVDSVVNATAVPQSTRSKHLVGSAGPGLIAFDFGRSRPQFWHMTKRNRRDRPADLSQSKTGPSTAQPCLRMVLVARHLATACLGPAFLIDWAGRCAIQHVGAVRTSRCWKARNRLLGGAFFFFRVRCPPTPPRHTRANAWAAQAISAELEDKRASTLLASSRSEAPYGVGQSVSTTTQIDPAPRAGRGRGCPGLDSIHLHPRWLRRGPPWPRYARAPRRCIVLAGSSTCPDFGIKARLAFLWSGAVRTSNAKTHLSLRICLLDLPQFGPDLCFQIHARLARAPSRTARTRLLLSAPSNTTHTHERRLLWLN